MLSLQSPVRPATKSISQRVRTSPSLIPTTRAYKITEGRCKPFAFSLKSFLAMLLRRKWLILLTTLLISLVGVISYLLMKPTNITISTVLLAGVLSGLFIGSMMASLREWKNSLLLSQSDLQKSTGYQVIGVIPEVKKGESFLVSEIAGKPYSRIAEAYRQIATLLLHGEYHTDENRIILITSINVSEGKSVSASNIAYCLAELGTKVLLVDADFRMPSVHFKLGIQNKIGLINHLQNNLQLSDITQHILSIPGLFVITAGSSLDFSPVNLLSKSKMVSFLNSARKHFDFVILDAPPIRGFADTLLLHSMASSTIVVVPEKAVQLDDIKSNLNLLVQVKPSITGLLKVRAKKDIVHKDYYRNYSREALMGRFSFKKKKKLNLGKK